MNIWSWIILAGALAAGFWFWKKLREPPPLDPEEKAKREAAQLMCKASSGLRFGRDVICDNILYRKYYDAVDQCWDKQGNERDWSSCIQSKRKDLEIAPRIEIAGDDKDVWSLAAFFIDPSFWFGAGQDRSRMRGAGKGLDVSKLTLRECNMIKAMGFRIDCKNTLAKQVTRYNPII